MMRLGLSVLEGSSTDLRGGGLYGACTSGMTRLIRVVNFLGLVGLCKGGRHCVGLGQGALQDVHRAASCSI